MTRWLMLAERSVPAGDAWLGPAERRVQDGLRTERRRRDWRLGRFAAKSALIASRLAGAQPFEIEILPDADGAPHAFHRGAPAPCSLSLSHRAGFALSTVADAGQRIGCDLEWIEGRSDAFIADYFTERERRLVEAASPAERARLANLVWSAKESAVKALGTGWSVDTRSVEVDLEREPPAVGEGWHGLRVHRVEGAPLRGGWRREGNLLLTWAAGPGCAPPLRVREGRISPEPAASVPAA